jgi:hypothetical protein
MTALFCYLSLKTRQAAVPIYRELPDARQHARGRLPPLVLPAAQAKAAVKLSHLPN